MIKKLLVVLILAAMSFALYGCRTTEGFGEDVQWTGEQIQNAAD